MALTVLSVAYPLAPVGRDAVGGAEQVLSRLDAALVEAGHRSLVVACEGSMPAGKLIPLTRREGPLDAEASAEARAECRAALAAVLEREAVDLVHMHGLDFHCCLPSPGVPVLATLHLPPSWYPAEVFRLSRPRTWLHCVSRSQERACPPCPFLFPAIENGVDCDGWSGKVTPRRYALSLGRICPEKGFHLALEAARRADIPLVLAGEVFHYKAHERYYHEEIMPRLDGARRFIGPVGGWRKQRLLAGAHCLLVPSLAAETSSLVAMEALACGTPVVAFPSGALADIVEDGRTGFLVRNVEEMAAAVEAAESLDRTACRESARRRFSLERMVGRYLDLYHALARGREEAVAC